ncbi:hypothetical protein FRC19_004090 [Serendipita sp. 401]|nr:hypothetical protein FRC19_004090 [Serendipita sp. 401]
MRVTLSTTLTLVTCAVGTVLASFDAASYHMPRSALASDEYSFDQLADAYEQGLSDPRLPKRAIVKRFDPNTQATSKIGVFDTNTGESQGFLTIFGDFIRNTTTDPTLFQYSKLAGVGDKIDLEVSIQVSGRHAFRFPEQHSQLISGRRCYKAVGSRDQEHCYHRIELAKCVTTYQK